MAPEQESFLRDALKAFAFPVVGKNIIVLIFGVIMMAAIEILQYIPVLSIASIILSLYITVYLIRILISSASGANTLPDWPAVNNFLCGIIYPWFRLAFVWFICFLPTIIYGVYFVDGELLNNTGVFIFVILGGLYFPMALACVCVHESVAYINPSIVLRLIFKAPIEYILTCLLLLVILYMSVVGSDSMWESGILVRLLTIQLLSFYLSVVEMRIIGLVYRVAEARRSGGKR
ncbi:MAG: hypothetical protein JXA52_01190 [Planctomycetes bacterium]|nr:hypothetical protein [Planctomycetota bacterium]